MSTNSEKINRSVERIEASYAQTRHTLESKAHSCSWDAQGRCLYCPKRLADARLAAGARTGEIYFEGISDEAQTANR